MIRKAAVSDNSKIMDYLKYEPSACSLIIGYIENYGYDSGFTDVWIELGENNDIKGILLRYDNSFCPYSKGEFDVQGFAEILKSYPSPRVFSGKGEVTEKFENIPGLNIGSRKPKYLCELKGKTDFKYEGNLARRAAIEDVDRLADLRNTLSEFGPAGNYREFIKRALEAKSGRTYVVEKDGKIVACANTTVENFASTMIILVGTHPDYRGKGYASMCMNVLCRELINEGKNLCLFYDNPIAGCIYKRLGFEDVGTWNLYR